MSKQAQQRKIVKDLQDNLGEDTSVSVYVKKSIPKQSNYTMFYQDVNLELVKLLKPNACKLLLFLMSKTQYDNYIGVNQKTIKEELGYKTLKSIVDGLKELMGYNIVLVLTDIDDGRRNLYYLNPMQSWKGKVAKRIQTMKLINKENPDQMTLPFLPEDAIQDEKYRKKK
jgi:hypothetical protein